MIKAFPTKLFLSLLCLSVMAACSTVSRSNTEQIAPKLSKKAALVVLQTQLSQPYSIYKKTKRFRINSNEQQLVKESYLKQLEKDRSNGFIVYSQTQEKGFDYVRVESSGFRESIPVYALNLFGFAFPDGERVVESILEINNDVVLFTLRLIPGLILKSRGFTDTSRIYQGKAKLEYNRVTERYDVIIFEQFSENNRRWQKIGFEVESAGQKSVFFIDPDTELLYEFLAEYDRESHRFKAMQPYRKYIRSISD